MITRTALRLLYYSLIFYSIFSLSLLALNSHARSATTTVKPVSRKVSNRATNGPKNRIAWSINDRNTILQFELSGVIGGRKRHGCSTRLDAIIDNHTWLNARQTGTSGDRRKSMNDSSAVLSFTIANHRAPASADAFNN